jgi:peptidyl-prolyl cis-trans isomerase SurA
MKSAWGFALAAVVFGQPGVATADSPPANVGVLERVVAVVGHDAIFLSELRARTKPYLIQIDAKLPEGPQRVAAHSEVDRDGLNMLIDERLIAALADKEKVVVTTQEVEAGVKSVADAQGISLAELFQLVVKQGYDESGYRAEIRRALLKAKLLFPRLKAEKKGTLTDAERSAALARLEAKVLEEQRKAIFIERRL